MNETEIRRLMPPDDGLSTDRHNVIKERVMASIRDEKKAGKEETVRQSQRRQRLVPALAMAFALLMVGTAAGGLGLFPWQDQEILDEFGCRTPGSVEQLVAEAQAPDGGTHQLWITRSDLDSPPNGHILIERNAEGGRLGSAVGCSPPGENPGDYYNGLWVSVPSAISDQGALGSVLGHVPPEAVIAVVTFDDSTTTEIAVQTDGYFLGLVFRSDIRGFYAEFPEPAHLAAYDANGDVVTERSLP